MTTIELYAIYKEHSTISTDTRKIAEGSIFFALKGPNFNANTLVGEALKKVKNGIEEEREALKNLYSDIENGYGERDKYEEYLAFESDKITKISVLLNDYKEQKEVIFKTYSELHEELYTFSMSLLEKKNKSTK